MAEKQRLAYMGYGKLGVLEFTPSEGPENEAGLMQASRLTDECRFTRKGTTSLEVSYLNDVILEFFLTCYVFSPSVQSHQLLDIPIPTLNNSVARDTIKALR